MKTGKEKYLSYASFNEEINLISFYVQGIISYPDVLKLSKEATNMAVKNKCNCFMVNYIHCDFTFSLEDICRLPNLIHYSDISSKHCIAIVLREELNNELRTRLYKNILNHTIKNLRIFNTEQDAMEWIFLWQLN